MKPVKLDPPLELTDGESAVVSLEYDLNKAILDFMYNVTNNSYKSGETPSYCAVPDQEGFQGVRCAADLPFVAKVTK